MRNLAELVRWHYDVQEAKRPGWMSRLAGEASVSAASVSNFCKGGRVPALVRALEAMQFQHFAAAMGYPHEIQRTDPNRMGLGDPLIAALLGATDKESYAAACIDARIRVKPEYVKAVEQSRRDLKVIEEQSLDPAEMPDGAPLHDSELKALDEIVAMLTRTGGATVITTKPHAGCRYALRFLPKIKNFACAYTRLIHIHADRTISHSYSAHASPERTSNHMKRYFVRKSGLAPFTSASLAAWLVREKALAIVHCAPVAYAMGGREQSASESDAEKEKDFLFELATALRNLPDHRSPSPLLIVEWEDYTLGLTSSVVRPEDKSPFKPEVRDDGVHRYLEDMVLRYCEIRSMSATTQVKNDGPRWKRMRMHYARIAGQEGWSRQSVSPASIRFRALCASNAANYSCFDPTQGLCSLIGNDFAKPLPEVTSIKDEVLAHLRVVDSIDGNRGSLPTLRLISTGVYWFNAAMLRRLRATHESSVAESALLDRIHLKERLLGVYVRAANGMHGCFVASILVKAIVQDDWKARDPESRTKIHRWIAEILLEGSRNWETEDLASEYPFRAPWNDYRVILRAEAIRHFVRASASAFPADLRHTLLQEAYETFLSFGEFDREQSQSYFTAEPRENSGPAHLEKRNELSVAGGQYRLKLELLGLLSSDGHASSPPSEITFSPTDTAEYFREVGITHGRLLNLSEAVAAFDKGLASLDNHPEYPTNPNISIAKLKLLAHSISVLLAAGDIAAAERRLAEASEVFLLTDARTQGNEGWGQEVSAAWAEETRRYKARRAAIALALGERPKAIEAFRGLHEPGLLPLVGDRAIGYIDALMTNSGEAPPMADELADAWGLCERLQGDAADRGLAHQNLRFEVRRASIVRRLGHPAVAEAILDRVGLSLSVNGGSERVFKEFQLESAETLLARNRPRYALAVYAVPCFEQLQGTGAVRLIERCAALCARALKQIATGKPEDQDFDGTNAFWTAYRHTQEKTADPFNSLMLLPSDERVQKILHDLKDAAQLGAFVERYFGRGFAHRDVVVYNEHD